MELAIGKIKLVGPVLIPSISVFETQGKLSEALVLQDSLNEPITLLSAHDVARHPDLAEKVAHFRDRGGVVFLDSGGYEASRIGRYVEGYREAWSIEDFESAISNCGYDLAASFDTFIGDDEPSTSFQLRLIDFLLHDHEFVEKDKLVPVVHIHDFTGKPLEPDKVVDLIDRVAAEVQPRFIAIPERELGDGFCQKHSLIKMITRKLGDKGRNTGLHILGCGNPLSFAILAEAGIAMADGLEWCRNLVGPNYSLHHFQHASLFPEPAANVYNPTAEMIRSTSQHYLTLTLSRNLHALQGFMKLVVDAKEAGKLRELVAEYFGKEAAKILD